MFIALHWIGDGSGFDSGFLVERLGFYAGIGGKRLVIHDPGNTSSYVIITGRVWKLALFITMGAIPAELTVVN